MFHHSKCHEEHLWFLGGGETISINMSLKEVDSNPYGLFWTAQNYGGGNNCR